MLAEKSLYINDLNCFRCFPSSTFIPPENPIYCREKNIPGSVIKCCDFDFCNNSTLSLRKGKPKIKTKAIILCSSYLFHFMFIFRD